MNTSVERKNVKLKSATARKQWWEGLSDQWKKAFNEAMLNKGPVTDMPDNNGFNWIIDCPNYRFAGPKAPHPNMSFELTDLMGLEEMSQAEMISVTHHQVVSIRPISNLIGLTSLFLNDNQLHNLEGVEKMKLLKFLVVGSNEIKSLKPIGGLMNLETLQVDWNRLDSFEGLGKENGERMRLFVGLPNKIAKSEIDRIEEDLRIKVIKSGM